MRQDSIEELKENIKDAISLILESIKEEADIQKKKSLIIEVKYLKIVRYLSTDTNKMICFLELKKP